jgi:enoyl-CoA hydratase
VSLDDYNRLTFDRRDNGVLIITLNRPEKYNAADEEMHSELARVWNDVSADPGTRVAVITGAGKAFSGGGDLAMVERMAGNYDRVSHMLGEMSDLVYNMINCDKPIVSAINGAAVGAGAVAALLADIAIAAEDAKIGDGHIRLGVAAGDHAAIIWPLLAGMAKARYYLLTGEMLTGAEAERIGMIAKAVPRDQVLDEALRIAQRLATGPQQAIRLTRRSLNNWLRAAGPTFDQSAAYEMLTFLGPDVVEGYTALREKRAPRFPSAQADDPRLTIGATKSNSIATIGDTRGFGRESESHGRISGRGRPRADPADRRLRQHAGNSVFAGPDRAQPGIGRRSARGAHVRLHTRGAPHLP